MVKSKKMSKTSIAVIILALLLVLSMVLGLTGAWFTKTNNSGEAETNSLVFGHVGDVTIAATAVEHKGPNGADLNGRTEVMPGDQVKAGGVTITHNAASATEAKVYLLITDGTVNYVTSVVDADSDGIEASEVVAGSILVAESSAAQELKAGETIAIPGQILSILMDGKWYMLDGVNSGSATGVVSEKQPGDVENRMHSWEITYGQGSDMSAYDAKVGVVDYNKAGVTYSVGIMQTTNATAQQAYEALDALLHA